MNPSSPGPGPINTGPMPIPGHHRNPMGILLIASMGFSVLFLVLFIVMTNKWATIKGNYNVDIQKQYQKGKTDQSEQMTREVKEQIQTPYKQYTAPAKYGEFVVKYPKNWNSAADEDPSGASLNLMLHPSTVQLNGRTNPFATQIMMVSTNYTQYITSYENQAKQNKLKKQTITVSGIAGTRYEGGFQDRRTGIMIILPVRDKTLTLANYDGGAKAEFDTLVGQIKINP